MYYLCAVILRAKRTKFFIHVSLIIISYCSAYSRYFGRMRYAPTGNFKGNSMGFSGLQEGHYIAEFRFSEAGTESRHVASPVDDFDS